MKRQMIPVGIALVLGGIVGFALAPKGEKPLMDSVSVKPTATPQVTCPHCGQAFPIVLRDNRGAQQGSGQFSGAGQKSEGPNSRQRGEGFIVMFDQDGDGRVSKSEWTGEKEHFDMVDEDHDGFLGPEEASRGKRAERFIVLADKDEDSRVSKSEWMGQEERFDALDKNGDGFLGLAEVPREESAFIAYFDLDQNGTVSREEFSGPPARFGRLDSDSNGVVTAEEVDRSLNEEERSPSKNKTRDSSNGQDKTGGAKAASRFIELGDKNSDGRLSKTEWVGRPERFVQLDKNGDGFLEPAEAPRGQPPFIGYFDVDEDGTVSRKEFSGPPERFSSLDDDGNGIITAEEVQGNQSSSGKAAGGEGAAILEFHSDKGSGK